MQEFSEHLFRAQDGTRLYYREYGEPIPHQPSILCLSGLARNSKDYHRVALRLKSQGFHLVVLDYRGRGRSDYCADPTKYNPTVYLDDIRHLLTLRNLHKIILLGTSLGGLLGMGLGAALPSVLEAVILNDVGPDLKPDGLDRIIGYLSQRPVFESWEKAVSHIKSVFPQVGYEREEDWRWLTENSCKECDDGMIRYDWDPNIVMPMRIKAPLPDLWALFRSLSHVPVLSFRGGTSDILTEETFARMHRSHNNITCVTVPDVGHVPSLQEPESVEALDEFLLPYRRSAAAIQ
ncbi:alpha/beta fold hydrolase [Aestuariispira insulae]|uniref:Pimeloyl-ACP methyl ester carboxylesterase n=1 Tax=Aestuariispira insulae TaxID=1461337 RepID=A0A3D9HVE1_9PROT|nr:alpha/beta hydrolase [Aestuariispira insulae]RED53458.1 pimeloyl-ACP methyl ester carboxylesterase [Aestuariispira insulae]